MIYWGTSNSNVPSISFGDVSADAVYYGYFKVWPTTNKPNDDEFIYYTSDSQIINYERTPFDASVLTNTYSEYGKITCDSSITTVNDNAFVFYNDTLQAANDRFTIILLPDSVNTIKSWPFGTTVQYIYIPDSVTSIGYGCFEGCSLLNNVDIPPDVSINQLAFNGCVSLSNITFKSGNGSTIIGNQSFLGCTSLNNVNLPGNVMSIGNSAFQNCTSLSNIKLSEGLQTIGAESFAGCSSLYYIEIPSSVTSINYYTFGNGSNSQYGLQTHDVSVCFPDHTSIPTITGNSANPGIDVDYKTHYYVPDSLYSSWKTNRLWREVGSYIHPISDLQS